jgi:hypothetical protein
MALPESRDYTAIDAGPLAHTVINNLQDQIVDGKHGQIELALHPVTAIGGSASNYSFPSNAWNSVSGSASLHAPINIPVGSRIDEVNIYTEDDGVTANPWALAYVDLATGVDTLITATKLTTLTAAIEIVTFGTGDAGIPHTTLTGRTLVIQGTIAAIGAKYYGALVKYTRP